MTSDDEFFFDYLANIPNDVKRYSGQVAGSVDRQVDRAAGYFRDKLSHQSWLPSSLKPRSRANHALPSSSLSPPRSLAGSTHDWVYDHPAWVAALLAFIGTGGLLIYGKRKLGVRKRKARRAASGARKEIVVIAGSAHEAITRSVACDLERRGFIVFITVTSGEEEHVVENEAREDIRSLWLDLANTPTAPSEIHPSLYVIQSLITKSQAPMSGMPPHVCQLSGLILIPSLNFPIGPVATIPASSWADTINTRLLYPILTTQLFLPLLTTRNTSSSIVLLTPSIQSSLSSPFASPEVATTRALSGFATSLRQELSLLEGNHSSIDVIEMKLGNLDFGRQFRSTQSANKGTEVLAWQPQQRALYGEPYLSTIDYRLGRPAGGFNGTPARELHFALFDALALPQKNIFGQRKKKKQIVYVGRGSRTYTMVGNFVPSVLIGWMVGLRTGYGAMPSEPGYEDGNGYGSESWEKVSS